MATPEQLRRSERALAQLAANDLAALWRQVGNAVEARAALNDVLPALIQSYGSAAATLAADWYGEARWAAEVGGAFTAFPVSILDDQGVAELAGWATSNGTDLNSIRELAVGGTQRRIASWSRRTVMGSALADPRADGWQRVGVGGCKSGFCDMLIGRGTVYTETTADFAAHDHCRCSAVPAFTGRPRPVKPHTPTLREVSEADRSRVRDWIASH